MRKSKNTLKNASECSPWPWVDEDPIGAEHINIRDANGVRVGVVTTSWPNITKKQKVNAKLVKFAPQLLALVESVQSIINNNPNTIYNGWSEEAEKILAEIAKVNNTM